MADERLNVNIVANTRDAVKNIGNTEKAIRRLEGASEDVEAALQESFQTIGFAAAGASAAITAGLAVSVSAFADFEQGLAGVSKTTNIVGDELETLGDRFQNISLEIPVSTDELLELAQTAGQLGVTGAQNIENFAVTLAQLGRASDLQGEAAAATIARILTLTEGGVDNVGRFANVIVALGNNFAATEAEIAQVANRIAQTTAQFNLGTVEVLAYSTSLRALGVQSEVAGSVVGQAFQRIDQAIRQGGQSLTALSELTGIAADDLQTAFQEDSGAVFESLVNGLGRVQEAGGSVAQELGRLGLSGIRVNQVFGALAAGTDTFNDALAQARAEAERQQALQEEFQRQTETLSSTFDTFTNTLTVLGQEIGTVLAPAVNFALEGLSGLLAVVARSETLSTFVAIVGSLAAGLTGLVAALAGGAFALNAIRTAYLTASVAAAAFNVALGPVLVTIAAVGTGVALLASIIVTNWDTISSATQALGEAIADVFGDIVQFFEGIFPNAVAALRSAFNTAVEAVGAFVSSVTELFNQFFGDNDQQQLVDALVGNTTRIQTQAQANVDATRDALSQVRELQSQTGDELIRLRAEQFEQRLLQDEEFRAMLDEMDAANRAKTIEELVNLEETKQDVRRQALVQEAKERNEFAQRRRQEETALGKFLVDLEANIGKQKLDQTKQTFNNLQKLTQSENAVLKGIGKAAAITQITIDTAQAATSAITAFSFIPIVGPALGLAAAGAIIAFGATQISEVLSAQTGGIVPSPPGASQTRDSVPSLLQPGELVVPTQNFDEVVNAVAQGRTQTTEEGEGGEREPVRVELSLRDELVEFVEARIIERRNLGLSVGSI